MPERSRVTIDEVDAAIKRFAEDDLPWLSRELARVGAEVVGTKVGLTGVVTTIIESGSDGRNVVREGPVEPALLVPVNRAFTSQEAQTVPDRLGRIKIVYLHVPQSRG